MSAEITEVASSDRALLHEIGRLRLEVWREETPVNESLFPNGLWIEPLDLGARHWIATDAEGLVAAARLTFHETLSQNPDGYLWERAGRSVPVPAAHLCKLVVLGRARGQGIGRQLNAIRIEAVRQMGARSILVTASEKNSRLLVSLGFADTGVRESFPNRPGFPFRALEMVFGDPR